MSKRPIGRPPHVPTAQTRAEVKTMTGCGSPQHEISLALGIHPETLRKHYKEELRTGMAVAHSTARKALFQAGVIEKNPTLLIFYCKTQLGMSEKNTLELTGKDGGPVQFEAEQKATEALTHVLGQIAAAKSSLH
jgi:hypothetical protein